MKLPPRTFRWILVVTVVSLLGPYLVSRIVSPWRRVTLSGSRDATPLVESTPTLRIACYNIAHGRGLASSNWHGGSALQRTKRLDAIADLLRDINADVVVLNEVDFDSSWSHSVNQAQYLAEKADYPYWAEQRNLDFRVLFWKWRFGNAALSKYPILDAKAVDFADYSTAERLLAGTKRGIACTLQINDRQIDLLGAHLCHRSEAVRAQSAELIVFLARNASNPTIVAGDLNSSPQGFPASVLDPEGKNTFAVLDGSELFQRRPKAPTHDSAQFTYPTTSPNRVIDWILIPQDWRFEKYEVESSTLSDHRPVYADVELGEVSSAP